MTTFERIDAAALTAGAPQALSAMRRAATETGFAIVSGTRFDAARVQAVLATYAAFFALPEAEKAEVDMATSTSNRGWGRPLGEQVSRDANPDYKEVFDCGFELPDTDPRAMHDVYAPNRWPARPAEFRQIIPDYLDKACGVAMNILRGLSQSLGRPRDAFDRAFDAPMTLLRGNFYPPRPSWAGTEDFGIAAHTDYGCLTLLATDGAAGLEVQARSGAWLPLSAAPGDFIINFGEMMEMWTAGRVKATPHRVVGGAQARLSIPLFFNPSYDANVAPPDAPEAIAAGPYLARRFAETYVHLQEN